MAKQASILCPQDFSSCSELALLHACELAKLFQQPLELIHVLQVPLLPEPAMGMGMGMTVEALDSFFRRAGELLEQQRRLAERHGAVATTRLVEGSPARVIAMRTRTPDISLVVMGTHGRNALGRTFVGSVAERVLRTAEVPVMTVRQPEGVANQQIEVRLKRTYQRVAVAYDFSEPARLALEFAAHVVRSTGGRIELIHVHPGVYWGELQPNFADPWPSPELAARYMRFLEAELRRVVPSDLLERTRCHALEGDPKQAVLARAQDVHAELICVGATGKGGVERAMLGSVSHSIVRHSPVPVLTVP
ncbi:MAG: universal stress protein [Myxococcales bacterium]